MSRGSEAGVKALRPRTRRAKHGLDTGRASATLGLSGNVICLFRTSSRTLLSGRWPSLRVRFLPVREALCNYRFRSFVLGLPYQPICPAHSFLRKDMEPMRAGETPIIRLALLPTSVLLKKGHSIRIAMAGADVSLFERYPAAGTPVWTVYREAGRSSFLEFPVKTH
jgi:hypothetical protein